MWWELLMCYQSLSDTHMRAEQATFLLLQHFSLFSDSRPTWEIITGQTFVKGDSVLWPLSLCSDGKGELLALSVELCNGKWERYLFQIVDLSWVKWKSFMLGGRKRPKREKKPVKLKFQPHLYNYFLFLPPFFFFQTWKSASGNNDICIWGDISKND